MLRLCQHRHYSRNRQHHLLRDKSLGLVGNLDAQFLAPRTIRDRGHRLADKPLQPRLGAVHAKLGDGAWPSVHGVLADGLADFGDCACQPTPCSGIELIIQPRERDLGGFSVRRCLPASERRGIANTADTEVHTSADPAAAIRSSSADQFTPGAGENVHNGGGRTEVTKSRAE